MQSNRSSSNALRAQDSSDPAFDKQHTDSASHDQSSPHGGSPHPDPGPGQGPVSGTAPPVDTSAKQDAQPSIGGASVKGSSPAADHDRQSQDGAKEEGAEFTAADEAAHADTDGRTAHLASLAEQADIRQVLFCRHQGKL